jgi:MFS transporter, MHS family, shikimate and dehydroshikimate transport protein
VPPRRAQGSTDFITRAKQKYRIKPKRQRPRPEAAWVAELFPARLRYSGASLGFQLGAALSGGLTPILASALLLWTGATWSISVYLIAAAIVTLAATFAAQETARQPLN